MSPKRSILILAVLTCSVFVSRSVFADAMPGESGSDSSVAWQAADAEVPGSPDYKNRVIAAAPDTNGTWQVLETDDPNSVDFGNRSMSSSQNANAAWSASEIDNPHNAQPGPDTGAAVQ